MKKKIAFVTDSTAYLPQELRAHPDVYVVPIVVISEDKEYEDGIDLSSDQLYEMIRNNKEVPKTSQPSVGKFQKLYEDLKQDYDQAIAIHVSSKLSGTYASSMSGKDQADFNVEVIDSLSISYAITALINKGLELVNLSEDVNVKVIADQLRDEITKSKNFILVGHLEQLYKGGRMSGVQFLLGNVLQIKPILSINAEGELGMLERIRSEKKAISKIIELLKQTNQENGLKKIEIMHGNVEEKASQLEQVIKKSVPNVDIVIGEISSSLAVHAGEGTLAVFCQTIE
ncbi:hypothetical protein GCM10011351_11100 [Paraliobacillus quinghaiensis]|uniref:DegV family protein n=1 Tax=Paraliobacillus quinghaiensis TaxID=470815 RepID=A0A917TM36_9BACI|nr:DegV family protein [Paraliobacillus quinghaiensis]GGM27102.1 hypothetical protein GCM10011351_11100 [Paraliobacillus quinghaiensis]